MPRAAIDLELPDQAAKARRLGGELLRRGGALFGRHRVLLSDTAHLVDGGVDLRDSTISSRASSFTRLTYALGSAVAGAATSVAISTVSTVSGAVGHARGGRVQLAPLLFIGAPSALAAYVAASYAGRIDPRFVKLGIAVVLLLAAGDMLRRGVAEVAARVAASLRPRPNTTSPLVIVGGQILLGAVLGAVSGLVGLLLGSLRLPSMIRLGLKPSTAIGTNMAIGAVTGSSAAISALVGGKVNLVALAVVAPMALWAPTSGRGERRSWTRPV